MVETRKYVSGFYKGLIYCSSLNEAFEISTQVNLEIQKYIRVNLSSKVKRGCSEYQLKFSNYNKIRTSGEQPMNYNKSWKSIENEYDQGNQNWGKSFISIEGFNLNNYLIFRNWVAYARKIGDPSVSKLTNEEISGNREYDYLNKKFYLINKDK